MTFGDGKAIVKNSTKLIEKYCSNKIIKIRMFLSERINIHSLTHWYWILVKAKSLTLLVMKEVILRIYERKKYWRSVFLLDYRKDSYEMTIYSFWDIIGTIGGVYEFTKVILGIFYNIYASKLMKIDLINEYKYYS